MARKKIIFVIVEGPSDEQALGVALSQIYKKDEVFVHIVRGDITTQANTSAANILSRIGDLVRKYAGSNHFRKTDFKKIIHIVDMDGAFIPNDHVVAIDTAQKPLYSTTNINTCDKPAIEQRNAQKRGNINKLCAAKDIWNVSYQVFYMSCNLDHALYDKLNRNDVEKENDAYLFAKRYRNDLPAFWTFISASAFSVMTGYKESWDYIKTDLHSLERHSNLGLCFVGEFAASNR